MVKLEVRYKTSFELMSCAWARNVNLHGNHFRHTNHFDPNSWTRFEIFFPASFKHTHTHTETFDRKQIDSHPHTFMITVRTYMFYAVYKILDFLVLTIWFAIVVQSILYLHITCECICACVRTHLARCSLLCACEMKWSEECVKLIILTSERSSISYRNLIPWIQRARRFAFGVEENWIIELRQIV